MRTRCSLKMCNNPFPVNPNSLSDFSPSLITMSLKENENRILLLPYKISCLGDLYLDKRGTCFTPGQMRGVAIKTWEKALESIV